MAVTVPDDETRPVCTDVHEALHSWHAHTSDTNERASRVSAEGSSSTNPWDNLSHGSSNNQSVGCWHNPPWRV